MNPHRAHVPHPIPYQGSKRRLAPQILGVLGQRRFATLIEPFGGSGAITLASAHRNLADRYVLADSYAPLIALWQQMVDAPTSVSRQYAATWSAAAADDRAYELARTRVNQAGDPVSLLYVLARCVKSAPRFNRSGAFNQSADRRRRGRHPHRTQREIAAVAALLCGRVQFCCGDAADTVAQATPADLVYLDPPYCGTSTGPNRRYHQGITREALLDLLHDLDGRGVPYLLSYDGSRGGVCFGAPLPDSIGARRVLLPAGRSAQATLSGRAEMTVESLYISRHVV